MHATSFGEEEMIEVESLLTGRVIVRKSTAIRTTKLVLS
jgi:hypothetical protein